MGNSLMIRCKQNGALNIRGIALHGTDSRGGRRNFSRYIIVLMLLVEEWKGEIGN